MYVIWVSLNDSIVHFREVLLPVILSNSASITVISSNDDPTLRKKTFKSQKGYLLKVIGLWKVIF